MFAFVLLAFLVYLCGVGLSCAFSDPYETDCDMLIKGIFWPVGLAKRGVKNPMRWWTIWDEKKDDE